MSKLVDKIPDFLYKPAAINLQLLPKIQNECFKLFLNMYNKVHDKNKMFYYLNSSTNYFQNLKLFCPTLSAELERLKIYHLFDSLVFIQSLSSQIPMPVHRDYSGDDENVYGHFGLNIPVKGCQGTFTVFYTGELDKSGSFEHTIGTDNISTGLLAIQQGVVEIDRVETNVPLWVNNYALHSADNATNKTRMVLSLRFKDMQQLFDSGYFDEHLVVRSENSE
jgi:hypothetical protein